jgi:hypothetical protein
MPNQCGFRSLVPAARAGSAGLLAVRDVPTPMPSLPKLSMKLG